MAVELEIIGCPECQAPAEVEVWAGIGAAGSRAEHVRIRCVRRHWFLLPRHLVMDVDSRQEAELSEG
jgi:hypothetical protein